MRSYRFVSLFSTAAGVLLASAAQAQAPTQSAIFPPGGQRGTTTPLTIAGGNLQGATAVLVSGQGVTAKITKNDNAAALPVELTIAADAEPGPREVRVVTPRGASNARRIFIDVYKRGAETEPNNQPAQATALKEFPITVNGQANAAEDVDLFTFEAKEGETWVFDLNAARHRSALSGYLILRDHAGRDLKAAMEIADHDPRIVYTFPKAGTYTLLVRDKQFRGGADYTYSVNVGLLPVVTAAMPLGAKRGETVEVSLEGANLGDTKTMKVTVPADPARETLTVVPVAKNTPANPVTLILSDVPETVEREPNNAVAQATPVAALPVALNGRIGADRDVDLFKFAGQEKQALLFEVFGRRADSRIDSVIRILDKDGKELSANDDAVGKDSRLSYTIPANGEYFVEVRSLDDKGGPDFYYRLRIGPPPAADFNLTVTPETLNIGPSGSAALTVTAARAGYNGDITLKAEGLPAGVTASPAVLRAGQTQALMSLTAAPGAAIATAPLKLVGEGTVDGKPVVRAARPMEAYTPPGAPQPAQRPVEMQLASVTEPPAYVLTVEPRELTVKQGATAEVTVKAVRKADFKAAINLAVLNNLLPAGVTAQAKPIPQDQSEVKFTLTAAANAGAATQNVVFAGAANNVTQHTPAISVTVAPK